MRSLIDMPVHDRKRRYKYCPVGSTVESSVIDSQTPHLNHWRYGKQECKAPPTSHQLPPEFQAIMKHSVIHKMSKIE